MQALLISLTALLSVWGEGLKRHWLILLLPVGVALAAGVVASRW